MAGAAGSKGASPQPRRSPPKRGVGKPMAWGEAEGEAALGTEFSGSASRAVFVKS